MWEKSYICSMERGKTLDTRPLLRIALSLIAGILVGDGLWLHVPLWLWLALAAICLGMALTLFRVHRTAQGALILCTTLLVGATLADWQNRQLHVVCPPHPVSYEAVVVGEPQVRGKILRCELMITQLPIGRMLDHPLHIQASLLRDTFTNRWRSLHVGSGIRAASQLEPLRPYSATQNRRPHFDVVRWLHVHGIVAQTFVLPSNWHASPPNLRPLPWLQRIRLHLLLLRQRLLQRYRMLGLNHQSYAVVAAMTLGDKSQLNRNTQSAYAVAGASHVLALSGLHLGIIYTLLTLLLGRFRHRAVAQGAVLTAIWTYAALVGLPPSVVRSASMLTIYALCLLLGRQRASVNTLAFAAIILLIANPLCLWDVGFQLSFLAVLSILIYYRPLYRLLHLQNPFAQWIWGLTCISIAAQLGTAPLVMYYFGRFSCYFLPANFLVVPGATAILYGAVFMLLATPIPPLQQYIATALGHVADWLNASLTALSTLPGSSIEGIVIGRLQLFIIYMILCSFTVIVRYAWKVRHQSRLEAFYK